MADALGFKEWKLVLDRLAAGRQSLLLRKGGIHEGRQGFAFDQEEFFLLPSYFHQQQDQLRLEPGQLLPEAPEGVHRIELFARCEAAVELHDRAQVEALHEFHAWSDELLDQRWDWEGRGMASGSLTVALVRVHRLGEPWEIADGPRFRGCRSWFKLGEPPSGWREGLVPVLDDETHRQRRGEIAAAAPALLDCASLG